MEIRPHNLKSMHLGAKSKKLPERLAYFQQAMSELVLTCKRTVLTAAGRDVVVRDPFTGLNRTMLMFASNNYLGLATHPHVIKKVKQAIDEFGAGIGGPPLLNGYIKLIEETEERISVFKSVNRQLFSEAVVGVLTNNRRARNEKQWAETACIDAF